MSTGAHHLAVLDEHRHERLGDWEALSFEGRWYRGAEQFERGRRVAGGLREIGVQPGDRVVVMMMNTPEVFVTYQAIWRAGAVLTPVIFLQTPPELRHILIDSEATAMVVTPELLGLVAAAAEGLDLAVLVVGDLADAKQRHTTLRLSPYADLETADPLSIQPRADDDLAALLYTGGTTGRSKGVMLGHEGLWRTGQGLQARALRGGTTRTLLPLPLSHAYGLIVTVAGMHEERHTVSVLQRWFDAAGWVDLVEEHRLDTSPMVPSMMTKLLAEPLEDHDLSSLVFLSSGGAPLPAAVRDEIARRLDVVVLEGYGLTENSAVVSSSDVDAHRAGAVGRALPGVTIEIRGPAGAVQPAGEDGEICVSGPGVMVGYWRSPEQSASTVVDGWLHTGDVGHLDQDGYLFVVDRTKDLIIRGGFNIYPRDVEEALVSHPEIATAAVVGRPDEERGEEVVAVVALRAGSTLTPEDVVAYSRNRLAAHKYPREVRIVDNVPLTSVGKTDRKAVRLLVRDRP